MNKNSNDYWSGRELQKLKGQLKEVNKLENIMKKQYRQALEEINSNIAKLYMRYAVDNKLIFSDASRLLTGKEFNEWKMSLREYIDLIESTGDETLLLELNTLAMKSRISRLEEMFYQIDKQLNELYKGSYNGTKALLEGAVKDSYYKGIFNTHHFLGVGKPFASISDTAINEVLTYPWSGANYSTRIWGNRSKLKKTIRQEMTQMIIQGKGSKEVAKNIALKMETDYRNAMRLVNTEHAYVMGEASARGYEETGVEEYEILSTLDNKTSNVCQKQDGKVYKTSEKKVGINYPPFHPNCRTTTVPYFDDEEEDDKRTARDPEGKTYEVPADMKYDEWYSKHVGNSAKDEIAATSINKNNIYVKKRILLKDGKYSIKEGTYINDVKVFAKGLEIREVDRLVNKYKLENGSLTNQADWEKVKGYGIITNGNVERKAELHWYQCNNIGKVEYKEKVWDSENN